MSEQYSTNKNFVQVVGIKYRVQHKDLPHFEEV